MRIIHVSEHNIREIPLYYEGEHLANQVVFSTRQFERYGPGTCTVLFQRPGEDTPYPVACVQDDEAHTVTITPTATELARSGSGRVQLLWQAGDILAKSPKYRVETLTSLGEGGDAPGAGGELDGGGGRRRRPGRDRGGPGGGRPGVSPKTPQAQAGVEAAHDLRPAAGSAPAHPAAPARRGAEKAAPLRGRQKWHLFLFRWR